VISFDSYCLPVGRKRLSLFLLRKYLACTHICMCESFRLGRYGLGLANFSLLKFSAYGPS